MGKKIHNHGIDVDHETLKQFEKCYSENFVSEAALMPDAHLGYAAPIGAVLKTRGFVVPAWVGFDIGCGLVAVRIKGKGLVEKARQNADKIYESVLGRVPMGLGEYGDEKKVTERTKKEFGKLLEEFRKGDCDKDMLNYLKSRAIRHLGTLGSGNHFIELGYDDKSGKELWLIIHSGSRGIGHTVAKKYMIRASGSSKKSEYERTFPLDVNSRLGREYLNVLNFGLNYALLNRMEMSYKVIGALEDVFRQKVGNELWVNKNHNHAIYERGFFIHRKGATPAGKNERGIIPGNMRDGSFLVVGKGSREFMNSSSHGAGRAMSRSEAKKRYSMGQFEESMRGIRGNISEKTLDELPMAYKDIFKVMDAQKKSVKVLKRIRPIINWKG
jgi:tRNA-splicing ligase RtcB